MTHPQLADHRTRFLRAATQVRQLDRGMQLWLREPPHNSRAQAEAKISSARSVSFAELIRTRSTTETSQRVGEEWDQLLWQVVVIHPATWLIGMGARGEKATPVATPPAGIAFGEHRTGGPRQGQGGLVQNVEAGYLTQLLGGGGAALIDQSPHEYRSDGAGTPQNQFGEIHVPPRGRPSVKAVGGRLEVRERQGRGAAGERRDDDSVRCTHLRVPAVRGDGERPARDGDRFSGIRLFRHAGLDRHGRSLPRPVGRKLGRIGMASIQQQGTLRSTITSGTVLTVTRTLNSPRGSSPISARHGLLVLPGASRLPFVAQQGQPHLCSVGMAGVERPCRAGMLLGVLGYEQVGSPSSLLIIVRGPSGSGKSSVAKSVRQRHGRGIAVLGQDVIRRSLLWERKDVPGGLAPDFIAHSAGFLLNAGWPVLVEGILSAASYGPALRELMTAHRGQTLVYFLRVEMAETFARHATRPEAEEFTITDMASWFEPDDRLDLPGEIVIPQSSSLADTVDRICRDARLAPVGNEPMNVAADLAT